MENADEGVVVRTLKDGEQLRVGDLTIEASFDGLKGRKVRLIVKRPADIPVFPIVNQSSALQ
jgi:hypothetical protein